MIYTVKEVAAAHRDSRSSLTVLSAAVVVIAGVVEVAVLVVD